MTMIWVEIGIVVMITMEEEIIIIGTMVAIPMEEVMIGVLTLLVTLEESGVAI